MASTLTAVADLDGDGDDDLVLAAKFIGWNNLQGVWIQRNHAGVFDNTLIAGSESVDADSVVIGDLNGDGAPDVLVSWLSSLWLATNDGAGNFTFHSSTYFPNSEFDAMALGDVDGNGTLDVVGGADGPNGLFLNDGTGLFTEASAQFHPRNAQNSTSIILADFDGDGDLDCYTGNTGPGGTELDVLAINDGTGTFVDASSTLLPATSPQTLDTATADVDGDGDIDIVLASETADQLLLNDGSGRLRYGTNQFPPTNERRRTESVEFLDVDRDGDPDLWIGRTSAQLDDVIFLNDGSGRFAAAPSSTFRYPAIIARHFTIADVNGDGLDDQILGTRFGNELRLNDGAGRFRSPTALPPNPSSWQTRQVAHADLNGDQAMDLVLVGDVIPYVRILLGDGYGGVTEARSRFANGAPARAVVELADIDGDADVDLIFTGGDQLWHQETSVWINDGSAVFRDETSLRVPQPNGQSTYVIVGDADSDGDPDMLVGLPGGYALLENDGVGFFRDVTATHLPAEMRVGNPRSFTDLDGDGDLDIIVAASPLEFLLNDGTGSFSIAPPTVVRPLASSLAGLAVGDIDGDGDVDLVVNDPHLRVYKNDGTGHFTWSANHLDLIRSDALVDADGDGALDLIGRDRSLVPRLYRNDGSGGFADATGATIGILPAGHVHACDLDGDMDPDVYFAAGSSSDHVLHNETRQLRVAAPSRLGGHLTLRVHSHDRQSNTIAFPVAAFAEQPTAFPGLGTVRPDLGGAIPLASATIPVATGSAVTRTPIPNLLSLFGSTIYVQALLVQPPDSILGITNSARTVIR